MQSSEANCARCFDFCTKTFPGGSEVSGNAKSLRVRAGLGAVGLYGDCSGHWNYIDPHFQTFAMVTRARAHARTLAQPHTHVQVADGCVKIVGTRPACASPTYLPPAHLAPSYDCRRRNAALLCTTLQVSHLRFYPAGAERPPLPSWAGSIQRDGAHARAHTRA